MQSATSWSKSHKDLCNTVMSVYWSFKVTSNYQQYEGEKGSYSISFTKTSKAANSRTRIAEQTWQGSWAIMLQKAIETAHLASPCFMWEAIDFAFCWVRECVWWCSRDGLSNRSNGWWVLITVLWQVKSLSLHSLEMMKLPGDENSLQHIST